MSEQKLREVLRGMLAIVRDSTGVAGYHLNGDVAEWDSFPEVQQAEEALTAQPAPELEAAIDALSRLLGAFVIAVGDKSPFAKMAIEPARKVLAAHEAKRAGGA